MSARLLNAIMEDQRIIILRTLCEAPGCRLNETILMHALLDFGHPVNRDHVRKEVDWLAGQGLVEIEKLPRAAGEFWIVKLTERGEEIIRLGRKHPGVAAVDLG